MPTPKDKARKRTTASYIGAGVVGQPPAEPEGEPEGGGD